MKEQATRRPDPQHKRLSTRRANSFWPSASQEVLLRMALQNNAARYPRNPKLNQIWQMIRRLQPRGFRSPEFLIRWNRRLLERNYTKPPPFEEALRMRLLELYADEVARVEHLLGRELPTWKSNCRTAETEVGAHGTLPEASAKTG